MRKQTFEIRTPLVQQNAIRTIQQLYPDLGKEISQARVKEVLHYEEESGVFTWKVRKCQRMRAGDVAGYISPNGYLVIRVDGRLYKGHRLAWLYVYGSYPSCDIDHINLIRSDNRIDNLRLATRSQNIQNTNKRSDNKSGYKGVSWDKKSKKWRSQIVCNGKKTCLGLFDNPADAHDAYVKKAMECFGKFARF